MRIVSLLPSATEILFAAGAGDEVVAVTHECDFPPLARERPVVTASLFDHDGAASAGVDRHIRGALHRGSSIYRLDESLLAAVQPELIVTQELCEVCAVSYEQVQQAVRRLPGEVPILSLEPSSLDDILATIRAVGEAIGRSREAASLIASLRERIARVGALARTEPEPVVACLEWTDPVMPGGHWVPEMVRLAGGRDPLGPDHAPSTYIAWEEVVAAQPEVMVLMPCGYGLEKTLELANEVTSRPGFATLPCTVSGRVFAVDGSSYFNRPGPRIVDGLELLAWLLRTEPGRDLPTGAAWIKTHAREITV